MAMTQNHVAEAWLRSTWISYIVFHVVCFLFAVGGFILLGSLGGILGVLVGFLLCVAVDQLVRKR
jgi:uncharacterized membrane protein YdjX (TVP38/TMEM64 family)